MSNQGTILQRLIRDCTFLKKDMIPLEESGKPVSKLNYGTILKEVKKDKAPLEESGKPVSKPDNVEESGKPVSKPDDVEESGKPVSKPDDEPKKDHEEEEEEEGMKLTCENICELADAIQANTVFKGDLDLEHQPLTDIACMHIGRILTSGSHLTKLKLAQDPEQCKFTEKAGEYIGQGILHNSDCGLTKLEFKGVFLGESGLQRVIEAANDCKTIEDLDVGIVTDVGLKLMAAELQKNENLEELIFYETADHQKYWTKDSMEEFAHLLKNFTKLKKVKAKFQKCNAKSELAINFSAEIEFYTEHKNAQRKKQEKMNERAQSCDTEYMFSKMLKYIEDTDKNVKMPVRKFFNNTFGQLLNDAIFALQKTKSKATGEQAVELQRHQGQIKFVANYLKEKMPKGENQVANEPETD